MELRIDREFESKIPPLTAEEFQQLEENILADGVVINPIIVWNGVIVDGHNRYRIIERHPEIRYATYEKQFNDRFAVIAWICKNQLGRRNLTSEQKKYLIGKQYEAEKQRQGTNNQYVQAKSEKCHDDTFQKSADTAERIARENGIGRRTVYRAEAFAKAVDIADDIEPGIRANLLAGEIKATEQVFRELIVATPAERSAIVEKMRNPPQKLHKVLPERKLLTMEQIAAQMPDEPMIITTNIPLSAMQKATDLADRRIYDRILEVCVPILFDGENFRKGNAAENLKKAARILKR